jgi:hypothetical protein
MRGGFDRTQFAKAFSTPGQTWVSYGVVDADTKDSPAVIFKDENDKPLPYGPMVSVTLQPTGVSVTCRVAMQVAGVGEGEWYPFVGGDEVLVVIPEGNERAGAVIIGRMNQEIDTWPTVVAGQDPTKNKFGFRRMRAPYILESVGGFLIRSATTGAQIGIDSLGQIIINDGDKGSMVLGTEALSLTSGDGESFITVLPPTQEVFMGAGQATFLLAEAGSKFISTGGISFATAGTGAAGMGVTAEQVVAFVINVITALGAASAFNPASPLVAPTALIIGPIVAAALTAMAAPSPQANSTPGGDFSLYLGTVYGPTGALAAAAANPAAPIDPTGTVLGFGRAGFRL